MQQGRKNYACSESPRFQSMVNRLYCFWVMVEVVHYGRRIYLSFWQSGRRGRWVKARDKIDPSKVCNEWPTSSHQVLPSSFLHLLIVHSIMNWFMHVWIHWLCQSPHDPLIFLIFPPMNVVLRSKPSTCELKGVFNIQFTTFFPSVVLVSKGFIFPISQVQVTTFSLRVLSTI